MCNPFMEKVSESLIGVANICLKALFYNSKLDYIVPVINTQGQVGQISISRMMFVYRSLI